MTRQQRSNFFYYAFCSCPNPPAGHLQRLRLPPPQSDDIVDGTDGEQTARFCATGGASSIRRSTTDIPDHPIAKGSGEAHRRSACATKTRAGGHRRLRDGSAQDPVRDLGGTGGVPSRRLRRRPFVHRAVHCTEQKSRDYAVHPGPALQLTNILRDIGREDAERDRIYLPPQEELARHGPDADPPVRRAGAAALIAESRREARPECSGSWAQAALTPADRRALYCRDHGQHLPAPR